MLFGSVEWYVVPQFRDGAICRGVDIYAFGSHRSVCFVGDIPIYYIDGGGFCDQVHHGGRKFDAYPSRVLCADIGDGLTDPTYIANGQFPRL